MSSDQVKYTNKLADARILVIGGTSGIGYAVAESATETGAASVILASSNPNRLTSAVQKLQASYPSKAAGVSGHTCDIGDNATLEANVVSLLEAATSNKTAKLDHIVVTAGRFPGLMPITSLDIGKFQDAMARMLLPMVLGKHAQTYMNHVRQASITFTTGSVSQKPLLGLTPMGGLATGLQGVCRGLALELKPMRVNLISPGAVLTPLIEDLGEEIKETLVKDMEHSSTTGKMGQPEDVAETYMAAIKDYNMTGTMLSTNSGILLV
ncbi:MAG: hypothetical protein M1831_006097 [Alyxoria varia]|nr:MAG: hypothetical protein M1831_006097 [Alyxoria varia]